MKVFIDQWRGGKSLKRLLGIVFHKSSRSNKSCESTAQTVPVGNTVRLPEPKPAVWPAETTTGSSSAHRISTREGTSSISTLRSKLLRRIRASRTTPTTDSPFRKTHSLPSGTALTEATSVSPPHIINHRKCRTCSYESAVSIISSNGMPRCSPLTARYPEIFTYMGRNDVPNSALALNRGMVKNLNDIFRLENQINAYRRNIDRVDEEYECVILSLKELNQMLPTSGATNQSDRDGKLEELKYLSDVSSRIQEQKKELQENSERVHQELSEHRKLLFSMLQDVLGDRNLLDSAGKNTQPNQFYRIPTTQLVPLHKEPHIPTHSEGPCERIERDGREAVDRMKEMGFQLQEAQQRLDNWKHYYESEYAEYAQAVKNGTMQPGRSFFDLTLLQEHREAIEEAIEAENEYERAREAVRELGVVLGDIYQESGFAHYPDDGYGVSMEEAMAGDIDRDWIESWMEKNDDGVDFVDKGDEWEAKPIGLDDSVSVVAKGRERKRIDRWQKRCMDIFDNYPSIPKALHEPEPASGHEVKEMVVDICWYHSSGVNLYLFMKYCIIIIIVVVVIYSEL